MKKIVIIIILLLVSVFSLLWVGWCYSEQKRMTSSISNVIGEKRYLEDTANDLLSMDSLQIDSVVLKRSGKLYHLSELVDFPCVVVYLPSIKENICSSCLTFALNEAKDALGETFLSERVCVVSVGFNPEIKERVYQKKCYVSEAPLIDVPKVYMPYYFVVYPDGHVRYLFCPNSAFEVYTSLYWAKMKSILIE